MKYGWYYTQVASRGAQNKSLRDASPKGERTLKIEDQTVQTTLKFLKSPAPGRRVEGRNGKLACRAGLPHGSRAAKTRSASGRPRARNAKHSEQ